MGTPDEHGNATVWSRLWGEIHRRVAGHVDAVITMSPAMARLIKRNDVQVIPCGVDTDLFAPRDRPIARARRAWDLHRRYVLFAADPAIPRKCFPVAQAAVEQLNRRGSDRVELVSVFKEPHGELPWCMAAADALVHTAYWEGGPVVVKEAMACNLPVVSVDVGDVPYVIGDTAGCYIVERDPTAVAGALAAVLDCPRPTLGRHRVEAVSLPRIAARLIAVYEAVVRRQPLPGGAHPLAGPDGAPAATITRRAADDPLPGASRQVSERP